MQPLLMTVRNPAIVLSVAPVVHCRAGILGSVRVEFEKTPLTSPSGVLELVMG